MANRIFDLFGKNNSGKIIQVPVESIRPSRYQPRLTFDETALSELSESIKTNGLITPITVREIDGHYEIIAGERRFRASQIAGFQTIPCYILSPDENQAAEMALVENIQRENLTAIEEAKAYVQIMRQTHVTQEQVAQRVGKSQSAVANKIRLLNLPDSVQQAVLEKKLSERHARALLSLPTAMQETGSQYIQEHGLNVRETEEYVERMTSPVETTVGENKKKNKKKSKGFTRSVKLGLNSVTQCVDMLKGMGVEVLMETEENDQELRVTLVFPK